MFDAELVEKCAAKLPGAQATDYRFLQVYGCTAPTPALQCAESLDALQEAAVKARELAQLDEFKLQLQREQNKWKKHQSDVQT